MNATVRAQRKQRNQLLVRRSGADAIEYPLPASGPAVADQADEPGYQAMARCLERFGVAADPDTVQAMYDHGFVGLDLGKGHVCIAHEDATRHLVQATSVDEAVLLADDAPEAILGFQSPCGAAAVFYRPPPAYQHDDVELLHDIGAQGSYAQPPSQIALQ